MAYKNYFQRTKAEYIKLEEKKYYVMYVCDESM